MFDFLHSLYVLWHALPRFVISLIWMFWQWFLTDPFPSNKWWILAGFILMPYTLLWYVSVYQLFGGDWGLWQYVLLIVFVFADIGTTFKSLYGLATEKVEKDAL